MSQQMQGTAVPTTDDRLEVYSTAEKGEGWRFFAGTILGLAGLMRIIDAIWAFRYKGALPNNLKDSVLGDNIKTYAWVYLLVGVVLILASFLVLSRSQLARWIGIGAAVIGALSAMTWMPYYPVWSLTYVIVAALVIYALSAYGGREAR
jgi:hypothetical protein